MLCSTWATRQNVGLHPLAHIHYTTKTNPYHRPPFCPRAGLNLLHLQVLYASHSNEDTEESLFRGKVDMRVLISKRMVVGWQLECSGISPRPIFDTLEVSADCQHILAARMSVFQVWLPRMNGVLWQTFAVYRIVSTYPVSCSFALSEF